MKDISKNIKQTNQKTLTPVVDESFYKFENVGDTLSGLYTEQGYSDRWKKPLYTVGDKRFLGKTQLDRLMTKVSIGDFIEIELIDTMTTPNGQMMVFEVRK
jgi:hypothetical protein